MRGVFVFLLCGFIGLVNPHPAGRECPKGELELAMAGRSRVTAEARIIKRCYPPKKPPSASQELGVGLRPSAARHPFVQPDGHACCLCISALCPNTHSNPTNVISFVFLPCLTSSVDGGDKMLQLQLQLDVNKDPMAENVVWSPLKWSELEVRFHPVWRCGVCCPSLSLRRVACCSAILLFCCSAVLLPFPRFSGSSIHSPLITSSRYYSPKQVFPHIH